MKKKPENRQRIVVQHRATSVGFRKTWHRSRLFRFWLIATCLGVSYLFAVDLPLRRNKQQNVIEISLIVEEAEALCKETDGKRSKLVEKCESFGRMVKTLESVLAKPGDAAVDAPHILSMIFDLQWIIVELQDFALSLRQWQEILNTTTLLKKLDTDSGKSDPPPTTRNTITPISLPPDVISQLDSRLVKIQDEFIATRKMDAQALLDWLRSTNLLLLNGVVKRFGNYLSIVQHNVSVARAYKAEEESTLSSLNVVRDAVVSMLVALVTLSVAVFPEVRNKETKQIEETGGD